MEKDVGNTPKKNPSPAPNYLQTSQQGIMKEIENIIGHEKPATEFKLQFAPECEIHTSIEGKKKAYEREQVFQEVSMEEDSKTRTSFPVITSLSSRTKVQKTN